MIKKVSAKAPAAAAAAKGQLLPPRSLYSSGPTSVKGNVVHSMFVL